MPSFVSLGSRARLAAALLAAAGCVAAAIAGVAACLTAPPPDIATSTNQRPEIVAGGVQPPQGLLDENQWPLDGVFVVPVIIPDPTATCTWRVFDVDMENPPPPGVVPPEVSESRTGCTTTVSDGGVSLQDVPIHLPSADGHCHIFTFIVAHGFDPPPSQNQPDSIGGASVSWTYAPSFGLCRFYDAGAFQDGAFPMDALADGLPVTPESGAVDGGIDP